MDPVCPFSFLSGLRNCVTPALAGEGGLLESVRLSLRDTPTDAHGNRLRESCVPERPAASRVDTGRRVLRKRVRGRAGACAAARGQGRSFPVVGVLGAPLCRGASRSPDAHSSRSRNVFRSKYSRRDLMSSFIAAKVTVKYENIGFLR